MGAVAHDWLGYCRYRHRFASGHFGRILAGKPRHSARLLATDADLAHLRNRTRANLHADGELVAVSTGDLHGDSIS